MRYAADLHLHSRHAEAVSGHMTLETIGLYARRKGIDLIGTGDCLHPEWLAGLEEKLVPAEPGWFALREDLDEAILATFPPALRQPLRFVLSTEVNCAPPGSGKLQGIHHLLYFPSFEAVHALRGKVERYGDLLAGRPTFRLTSRQLLELALETGCHFAPAHVMNPYFSSLGSQERQRTLEELFGELSPRLIAVEMGLTSIPPMCRRITSLDDHSLFANSDAHSPEKIGRECTLLDIEPGYDSLFAALNEGDRERVIGCMKFSIHRTRYFLNWCGRCQAPYDATACPKDHGRLATGSRDWLEEIAGRPEPASLPKTPRFRMYVPLRELLGEFFHAGLETKKVKAVQEQLLKRLGHERHILTKATLEEIAAASSEDLARVITDQRAVDHREMIIIEPLEHRQSELTF